MPTRYRVVLAAIGVPAVLIVLAAGPSPWLASLVAAVFLAAMMMTVRIRLEEAAVSIRVAGIFSTSIAYADLSTVSVGPATGLREGMGLRILPGEGTGYLVGGPSVRLQFADSAVLVSCADPEALIAGVSARIGR